MFHHLRSSIPPKLLLHYQFILHTDRDLISLNQVYFSSSLLNSLPAIVFVPSAEFEFDAV